MTQVRLLSDDPENLPGRRAGEVLPVDPMVARRLIELGQAERVIVRDSGAESRG